MGLEDDADLALLGGHEDVVVGVVDDGPVDGDLSVIDRVSPARLRRIVVLPAVGPMSPMISPRMAVISTSTCSSG